MNKITNEIFEQIAPGAKLEINGTNYVAIKSVTRNSIELAAKGAKTVLLRRGLMSGFVLEFSINYEKIQGSMGPVAEILADAADLELRVPELKKIFRNPLDDTQVVAHPS